MTEGKPPTVRVPPAISGPGPLALAAIIGVSLIPLAAIGIAKRDTIAALFAGEPGAADPYAAPDFESLGPTRAAVLAKITREAAAENGFRSGGVTSFPPLDYINRKLEERGEKWRVSRSAEGPLVARDIS